MAKVADERGSGVFEKARRMKLQMMAYLEVECGCKVDYSLDEYEKDKYMKMVSVFKVMKQIQKKEAVKNDIKGLMGIFKGDSDEIDWWIILVLMLLFRI